MGPVGWEEMVVIFIVALVLFGPKKLPELGRTLGKAITEFRRASSELKATFEREMQTLEREHESLKEVTRSYTNDVYSDYNSNNHYDSPYSEDGAYNSESYDYSASTTPSVSATAVEGAESTGTEPAAHIGTAVEGTVPRTTGTETAAATHSDVAHEAEAVPHPNPGTPGSESHSEESQKS
ncbi:MAG TPA: TatA/E family twin arginine-targeting protein translocase [Bryobacteraceae bacterium]|nr:TatA/E family twin arginine-targeting protein translocase [Bryobacteraceae bacterium]